MKINSKYCVRRIFLSFFFVLPWFVFSFFFLFFFFFFVKLIIGYATSEWMDLASIGRSTCFRMMFRVALGLAHFSKPSSINHVRNKLNHPMKETICHLDTHKTRTGKGDWLPRIKLIFYLRIDKRSKWLVTKATVVEFFGFLSNAL